MASIGKQNKLVNILWNCNKHKNKTTKFGNIVNYTKNYVYMCQVFNSKKVHKLK